MAWAGQGRAAGVEDAEPRPDALWEGSVREDRTSEPPPIREKAGFPPEPDGR